MYQITPTDYEALVNSISNRIDDVLDRNNELTDY